jgi:hypothetical protein
VLDCVKARALGEHPASKDPLHLAGQLDLVYFNKGCRMWRLGRRACVADPRRDLERPEFHGLVHGDLEMRDATRHLVECREHRDRIFDGVGRSELRKRAQSHSQGNCKEQASRGDQTISGKSTPLDHAAHDMNRLPTDCSAALVFLSMMALEKWCPQRGITLEP